MLLPGVDHDPAASDDLGVGSGQGQVCVARDVVVDDTSARGGDPDPELVDAAATVDLSIGDGQQEGVAADSVDGPGALLLGLGAGHDQPVVGGAAELGILGLEVELGLAGRRGGALLVLGDEPEGGPSAEGGIGGVGALRRVDPAAAGDETTAPTSSSSRGPVPRSLRPVTTWPS